MRPLFEDLEQLKAGISDGSIRLHIAESRIERLIELVGDEYVKIIRKICSQLQPDDFAHRWRAPNGGSDCADVYGILRDSLGEHSEEEYAWYIKIGVRPDQALSEKKLVLSFHPTSTITLRNGTVLRTTVDDYDGEANK